MAATLIADMHQRSGSSLGGRHKVGAIYPQVPASQARRAALVHGNDWKGIGQGVLVGTQTPILRGMMGRTVTVSRGAQSGCRAASRARMRQDREIQGGPSCFRRTPAWFRSGYNAERESCSRAY